MDPQERLGMIRLLGLGSCGVKITDTVVKNVECVGYLHQTIDYDVEPTDLSTRTNFHRATCTAVPMGGDFVAGERYLDKTLTTQHSKDKYDPATYLTIRRFIPEESRLADLLLCIKGGGGGSGFGMYRAVKKHLKVDLANITFVPVVIGPFGDEHINYFLNTAAWLNMLRKSYLFTFFELIC